MASEKIMMELADKLFMQRVAFVAMQVAQRATGEPPETPNYGNRLYYNNLIFRGDDRALLLAVHAVSNSPEIMGVLEAGTATDVTDEQLTIALEAIWDTRATAFGSVTNELYQSRLAINEAVLAAEKLRERMEMARLAHPPEEPTNENR